MKNKILPIIFLFILSSCGYKSSFEAMYECKKWANEAKSYKGLIKAIKKTPENEKLNEIYFTDTVNSFPLRKCEKEAETKKVLGLEIKNREANKVYVLDQGQRLKANLAQILDTGIDWVVIKRFKY